MVEKNIIASIQYNNPEFIPLQIESINKYCQDNFDFFVVDNSKDKHVESEINRQCNLYNIFLYKCSNRPYTRRRSKDHGASINEFKNYFATHYKKENLIIVDSDMFLSKTMSFDKYFKEHKMFGWLISRYVNSEKVSYLWPGYCGFRHDCDFNQLDFSSNMIGSVWTDVGGFLFHYIKDKLDQVYILENHDQYKNDQHRFETTLITHRLNGPHDENFHFVQGSNWNKQNINDYKNRKKIFLKQFNLEDFSKYAIDQFLNNFEGKIIKEQKILTYAAQ